MKRPATAVINGRPIRLDDTSGCPRHTTCENCGSENDVFTVTAGTTLGVHCLGTCNRCWWREAPPSPGDWGAATDRAIDHCDHLGINAREMEAVLRGEEVGQSRPAARRGRVHPTPPPGSRRLRGGR